MDGDAALGAAEPVHALEEEVLVAAGDAGVGGVVEQVGRGDPDDAGLAAVRERLGNRDGEGEGAVDVAVLLFVGAHGVTAELGIGGVRGREQLGHADRVARRFAHDEALGQGQAHVIAALGEGRGYLVTAVLGQKVDGRGEEVVAVAALDDDAVRGGDAVVLHDGLEVRELRAVLERAGDEDELASGLEVLEYCVALGLRDVAHGGVYEQAVRVLGHAVAREQGQALELDVLLGYSALKGAGELALAVAGEGVELGQVLVRDVVDGAGERALAREALGVGAGGVVVAVVVLVDAGVADVGVPVAALDDEAVVVDGALGVLLHEGGLHVGVDLGDGELAREGGVAVEEGA